MVAEATATHPGPTPELSRGILVIGGGIAGVSAALEAAEAGYDVTIVEKNPYLGGRVAQLARYFPKLCPPYCGLEINFRRIRDNPRVVSKELATLRGVELLPMKADIRKLKALGLTISHDVGYELSPRGAAYLDHLGG